jgi:hypothetical protein
VLCHHLSNFLDIDELLDLKDLAGARAVDLVERRLSAAVQAQRQQCAAYGGWQADGRTAKSDAEVGHFFSFLPSPISVWTLLIFYVLLLLLLPVLGLMMVG